MIRASISSADQSDISCLDSRVFNQCGTHRSEQHTDHSCAEEILHSIGIVRGFDEGISGDGNHVAFGTVQFRSECLRVLTGIDVVRRLKCDLQTGDIHIVRVHRQSICLAEDVQICTVTERAAVRSIAVIVGKRAAVQGVTITVRSCRGTERAAVICTGRTDFRHAVPFEVQPAIPVHLGERTAYLSAEADDIVPGHAVPLRRLLCDAVRVPRSGMRTASERDSADGASLVDHLIYRHGPCQSLTARLGCRDIELAHVVEAGQGYHRSVVSELADRVHAHDGRIGCTFHRQVRSDLCVTEVVGGQRILVIEQHDGQFARDRRTDGKLTVHRGAAVPDKTAHRYLLTADGQSSVITEDEVQPGILYSVLCSTEIDHIKPR